MTLEGTPVYVLTDRAARVVVARGIPPSVLASEKALLGGKKAKTPIVAGSVCGGIVFLAWLIGFGIYFRKRYNRKQRNRAIAAGKAVPREKDVELAKERVVIPPDPAILLGQRKPGDIAFPEREHAKEGHHHLPWSHHAAHANPENSSQTFASASSLKGPPNSPDGGAESLPNRLQSLSKTTEEYSIEAKEDSIVDEMAIPATV